MIILDWLLQEHRKGNDINYFSKFSILLSEMLAEKHFILRKKCKKTKFFVQLYGVLISSFDFLTKKGKNDRFNKK
jgi:hypothetical protein